MTSIAYDSVTSWEVLAAAVLVRLVSWGVSNGFGSGRTGLAGLHFPAQVSSAKYEGEGAAKTVVGGDCKLTIFLKVLKHPIC